MVLLIQQNLNQIVSKSSIIVIPSTWQEPFGLVAAEAMSHGTAIIASNVGGLPEIIKKHGILINKINAEKISNKLKELMNNENLLKSYQKNLGIILYLIQKESLLF